MQAFHAAQAYRRTEIQSASPLELVVALYDAALRSTGTARDAIARRDIPARRDAINRVMDIVAELQNALDLERGGRIARELDGLYTYVLSRLLEATARQDAAPLDDVQRILSTLREAWQHIAAQPVAAQVSRP